MSSDNASPTSSEAERRKKEQEQRLEVTELSVTPGIGAFGRRLLLAGRISGHEFSALLYPTGTPIPGWDIKQSGIVMLHVRRLADERVVFHWDRGKHQMNESPSSEKMRQLKESVADKVVDAVFNGSFNEACEKYLKSRKEIAPLSRALVESLTKMSELRTGGQIERSAEVEGRQAELSRLKRHWNEALEAFGRIEQEHGLTQKNVRHDEVEQFRNDLDTRLKKLSESRPLKHGLNSSGS